MIEVKSEFEAEVNELHYHTGAMVRAGDNVVTLSVCKMLQPIAAPVDGIIEYRCNPGDYVIENQTLARIAE
jgi:biotin carboxyl carrier protein